MTLSALMIWGFLKNTLNFGVYYSNSSRLINRQRLLIDDSLAVLNSARLFGIAHLISVSKPDSKQPKKNVTDYPAIEDFRELMIGL